MENYSYNSSYPESGDSSPRSREIEFDNPPPWEDPTTAAAAANYKVKFMCSYGGKIHPRPNDNQLSYIGGETKILAVDRGVKFGSLFSKLIAMCDNENISFKYQLPGEDLDALISVTNDDDLEHMMHEYERLYRASPKPARLRIFIFPTFSTSQSLNSSARSFGSDEVKSEKERFVEALNSAPIMTAPPPQSASPVAPQQQQQPLLPPSNVDFLFGLEKAKVDDPVADERFVGSLDPIQKHIQDLQRLRLEEQQGIYRRTSDDNLSAGGGGEYYRMQEKVSPPPPPVTVHGGVPYWTEKQQVYASSNEQPVYMIPPPTSAYHAPVMRQVTGAPPQGGYYTVQRMAPEAVVYRDQQQQQQQQQQMYNMIQQQQPQKATGYSEGFGVVGGYTAQMAYDSGMGRQVIYAAPGGVMGAPAPMQAAAAAQYQAVVGGGGGGVDVRQVGALNAETGGKGVPKVTQTS